MDTGTNNQNDDTHDDFFDSADRSVEKAACDSGEKGGRTSPTSSKSDRRRSESSNRVGSPDQYSDSDSRSDRDSRDGKPRKPGRRSRSPSSRSRSSYSSDSGSSRDSRSRSAGRKRKVDRRSRSWSSSATRSLSRTGSPVSAAEGGAKERTESEGRALRASITVPSAYHSNSDEDSAADACGNNSPRPEPDRAHHQAWNSEADINTKKRDLPKTKRRSSKDRPPLKKELNRQRGHKDRSSSQSDSDMTDVSSMGSPPRGKRNGEADRGSKDERCHQRGDQRAASGDKKMFKKNSKGKTMDMNILLKAVTELEKHHRIESNTRRVMFEPVRGRNQKDKPNNFTFTDDDTRRIDQENQRLLYRLMRQMNTTDGSRLASSDHRLQRPSSATSAVNRRKEHTRIERENMALLKRIQSIKPSRGLARSDQLSAYHSTILHGVPIATMQPSASTRIRHKGSRAASSVSSTAGSLSRTRSVTSVQSAATAASSVTAESISTSATGTSNRSRSRPGSSKKRLRERPPWDDRW